MPAPKVRVRNEFTGETYDVPETWPDRFSHLKRVGGHPKNAKPQPGSPVRPGEETMNAPTLGEEE